MKRGTLQDDVVAGTGYPDLRSEQGVGGATRGRDTTSFSNAKLGKSQIKDLWSGVGQLCKWKHPRVARVALLFEGERAIPTFLRETEVSQTVSTPPPAEEERGRAHLETFSFPSALCFTFSLFSFLFFGDTILLYGTTSCYGNTIEGKREFSWEGMDMNGHLPHVSLVLPACIHICTTAIKYINI